MVGRSERPACFFPLVMYPESMYPESMYLKKRKRQEGNLEKDIDVAYYGMIENIDDNLGRLETFLQKNRLKENTILIYLSDNGTQSFRAEGVYNAGMRGKKRSMWEGGHRVPLFVRWENGGLRIADLMPVTAFQLSTALSLAPLSKRFARVTLPACLETAYVTGYSHH